MASARSTVSIARTTPAQKPRGEQSTILRSGFGSDLARIGAISGPNHPSAGRAGSARSKYDLGLVSGAVKALQQPIAQLAPVGIYRAIPVIADDHRLRLQNRWAKHKGDLP